MNCLWSSEPQWVSTQYLIKCCLCDTDYFKSLWCYLVVVQFLSCVQLFATHGLQHARPPCPSPTVGAYSNPCPLSRWCHPTISSSVIPFSSHLQSFPVSGSFPMSQFFASGGQSIGVSASTSVPPMNIQDWFPLRLTGLISLQSRDSQESSPTPQFKSINYSVLNLLCWSIVKRYHTSKVREAQVRW